jgi:hypothetical protein
MQQLKLRQLHASSSSHYTLQQLLSKPHIGFS